ncbi:FAD/NAD(P)-binding domain-containing protein [Penicillium odoratum]|uniref:FAD/NAD(P)-binding domain-containing protein n=1 Tax=Penicillium odoratum TaxID=1167516 RepID=UPI0025469CC2|nr:FAD/NAD(P)-binding domain-containing protein [Penicillium odoratum]KAJ5772700.1 FAD/NAD(P)-binding domain-containing protein [Penicillium odoratum]
MKQIDEAISSGGSGRPGVDRSFIEGALKSSHVNALRLALYQLTGDVQLGQMEVTKEAIRGGAMLDYVLGPEDEAIVQSKAAEYLTSTQVPGVSGLHVPSLKHAQGLMKTFRGEELTKAEIPLGYEELSFQAFSREVKWSKKPSPETLENFQVVIIGSGINADIGGTWMQNTYPEARVDTLGFSFQYEFESGYHWTEIYPSAPELRGYLDHVATKYGVKRRCMFNLEVIRAEWDDSCATWTLTLQLPDRSIEFITANAIISAVGLFSTVNLPDFPGIQDFKGHVFHKTQWDHSINHRGLRAAVIGNGSSGAQLIPGLGKVSEHLTIF